MELFNVESLLLCREVLSVFAVELEELALPADRERFAEFVDLWA